MSAWQNNFSLLFVIFFLTGCAKLAHLQELLTLKNYSEEKDRQNKYIEKREQQFDALCRSVKDGTITQRRDRQGVRREFGDPIYIKKTVPREGEVWLYRYPAQWLGSAKVYLNFAETGVLESWRYEPPAGEKKEVKKSD